jgi:hypothetical protein
MNAKKAKAPKKRNAKPSTHTEITKFIEQYAKKCVVVLALRDPKGEWDFSERSLHRIETFIKKRWDAIEKDGFCDAWQFLLGAYVAHVLQLHYNVRWSKTKDFGWDFHAVNDAGFGVTANPFNWVATRIENDKGDSVAPKYKVAVAIAKAAELRHIERKT